MQDPILRNTGFADFEVEADFTDAGGDPATTTGASFSSSVSALATFAVAPDSTDAAPRGVVHYVGGGDGEGTLTLIVNATNSNGDGVQIRRDLRIAGPATGGTLNEV